jgi:hypothetical protein
VPLNDKVTLWQFVIEFTTYSRISPTETVVVQPERERFWDFCALESVGRVPPAIEELVGNPE